MKTQTLTYRKGTIVLQASPVPFVKEVLIIHPDIGNIIRLKEYFKNDLLKEAMYHINLIEAPSLLQERLMRKSLSESEKSAVERILSRRAS